MKRIVITLALVALALPAVAQEDTDFAAGEVTLGLWQRDSPGSSKFLEYRDIPQGAVLPFFQFQGRKGDYHYNFFGYGVTQKDQRYFGVFESQLWKLEASYTGIPHNFGNAGRSILSPVNAATQTEWRMSDTLQAAIQSDIEGLGSRNYDTVLPIVQPTLDAQPNNVDLRLQRNRTNLAFSLFPGAGNFDIGVTYLHERRTGTRSNNGTSFGFNNVLETPEPMKYITQDFGVNATLRGGWGSAFAGLNFNDFENQYTSFAWDNPFRAVDSTASNAYLGPYSTVEGTSTGLAGLPPSNQAWTVKAGTTLNFGRSTRLSADAQVGQWKQNEQNFIGWTTNTAIFLPDGRQAVSAPLPANNLDGKMDVLALNGYFTTRLADALRLNARYRHYENENKTPRIRFEEGYVRFDAVWEEIPRITVPNGFKSDYFDAYATYDVGRLLGLEVGWKYNKISREYRETEHTTENMLRVAADVRFDIGLLRGIYEFGNRDFDNYHPVEAEEHSFLEEGQPANQTVLRRFDQAKRDRDRLGAQFQISPGDGRVTLGASYFWNKDQYDDGNASCNADYHAGNVGDSAQFCASGQSPILGLLEAEYKTFSVDADFTISDNASLYAYYTREDIMDYQTGRQSGGTITFDPGFNWSSTVDDKVDSFGAGANFTLVPDKWFLSLFARYQKVNGNNDFTGGDKQRTPESITRYDDTKLTSLAANLKWQFTETWAVGFGAYYEDYKYDDAQTGEILNYMPGSFFLNPNNGTFNAWVGWLNLTYNFK